MRRWLYKFMLNRRDVGPRNKDGEICCVPECGRPASEHWFPSVCALREAGVNIDWVAVCAEHDADLNDSHVRLLFGDRYDAELAAYRERRVCLKLAAE